jgi:hypothetical protein
MKNLITIMNSKELGNIWSSAKNPIHGNSDNIRHHEHIGAASKSDVSPNTPTADETDL